MRYLPFLVFLGVLALGSQSVLAQTQTTPNLINPAGTAWGIPSDQVLNNGGITAVEGAGPTTGTAYYNSDTNTIRFSYLPSTVSQTIAINSVLSGLGIQVRGYNWSYQWMNGGQSIGTLTGSIYLINSQDQIVEQTNFNHAIQPDQTWQVESGTRTFINPYDLAAVNTVTMTFSGQESLFWAGLYGPRVRNPSLSLNYGVDQCVLNPLSSPDCPGYFQAQCTISPLYNPACPGYQQAFLQQQCSINPLYDPTCPGYQAAYFQYQCQQDGLYSTGCPNYAEAYAKKQLLSQTTTTETTSTTNTGPVSTGTPTITTSSTSPTSVTSTTSVISSTGTGTTANVTTTVATTSSPVSTVPTPTTTQETRKTDTEIRTATQGSSGTAARGRAETRAREITKAAAQAPTLEAQAETQGLVVGLIGFVPGFDAYSQARIADINAATMQRQYTKPTVDNRSALRQLSAGNESRHKDMVDQQYR